MSDPAVVLVAKNELTRKRAQQVFMEMGGKHGVPWRFTRMYSGGIFCAEFPDHARTEVFLSLLCRMQERSRPYSLAGVDWLMSGWREPLTPEQMENFNGWRQACHERGMAPHHTRKGAAPQGSAS